MTRQIVLRVERDERGMYTSCLWGDVGAIGDGNDHPAPWNDGLGVWPDDHRFGFQSKRLFLQWVYNPTWRRDMTAYGGELCVYVVDKQAVRLGGSQCTFSHEEAELVQKFPVNVLDTAEGQDAFDMFIGGLKDAAFSQ